jgi:4-carboxymuconolactone decarboxylase
MDEAKRHEAGMKMRRKILGDAHVDRSVAGQSTFNAEFQDLIVRYAWGEIWTRPGLDHRTRRLLVLTSTASMGRWEEFRMHVRAGLEGGLPLADIKETLLQLAIYAGVPAANTAFHIVEEVLAQLGLPEN